MERCIITLLMEDYIVILLITADSILFGGLGLFIIVSTFFFKDALKLTYKQAAGIYLTYIIFTIFIGFIYGHDYRTTIVSVVFIGISLLIIILKKYW
jgi:hypothetical protein